jgi:SAM-dependent methyltransferase
MKRGASLLDIGSGTGEDAVWLQARGFQVTGIDPSPAMCEIAAAKASRSRDRAVFHNHGLLDFKAAEPFDAVYSNFGAMNCIPIGDWAAALSRLVVPGGKAFLVLMGGRPLPLLLREGPSAWTRRTASRVRVGAGSVDVAYPAPSAIKRALGAGFRIERTETLGALVPSPGMADWPRRNPILFGLLAALEKVVSRRRVLARFSDHFLIELTKL